MKNTETPSVARRKAIEDGRAEERVRRAEAKARIATARKRKEAWLRGEAYGEGDVIPEGDEGEPESLDG